MIHKDIICKDYRYEDIIPYQLDVVTKGKVDIFLPITFEVLDSERIKLCYDLSDVDPIGMTIKEWDAPYIASSIISGMREAMDYYIFPSQYLLKEKVTFICRNGNYKIAYVPSLGVEMPPKDPNKLIRRLVFNLLQEIYDNAMNNNRVGINKQIVEEVKSVLTNNMIGMDTCMRRIDSLKEEKVLKDEGPISKVGYRKIGLELSNNIL